MEVSLFKHRRKIAKSKSPSGLCPAANLPRPHLSLLDKRNAYKIKMISGEITAANVK